MSQELINTSAAQGIKPGSSGFCTVVQTPEMPRLLEEQLTMLSGYRRVFQKDSAEAWKNPVLWSHARISVGGKSLSILSRVCDAGVDYSQRSNRFAHHIALDAGEQPAPGPAWLMRQPRVMESTWSGGPQILAAGRPVPDGLNPPRVCSAWETFTGDAAWAGVLADAFMLDASRPAYILFEPGMDILPLIDEAIALLPESQRWRVTFNTYFTELQPGLTCSWRCCVAGTPAARDAQRFATSGVIIDLTRTLGLAPAGRFTEMARTGRMETMATAVPMGSPSMLTARAAGDPFVEAAERELLGSGDRFSTSALDRSATQYAVAEESDGVDTSWMPPVSATAVITEEDSDPQATPSAELHPRSRTNKALWVVSILWPILAIAGVVTWHLVAESGEKRELNAQIAIATTRTAATTQLTEKLERAQATLLQKSTEAENARQATEQAAKQRDAATRAEAEAKRKLREVSTSLKDEQAALESEKSAHAQTKSTLQDALGKAVAPPVSQPDPSLTASPNSSSNQPDETFGNIIDDEWVVATSKELPAKPKLIQFRGPKPAPDHLVIEEQPPYEISIKAAAQASAPAITFMRFKLDPNSNRVLVKVIDRSQLTQERRGWLAMSCLVIDLESNLSVKRRLRPLDPTLTFYLMRPDTKKTLLPFVGGPEQFKQLSLRLALGSTLANWTAASGTDKILEFTHPTSASFAVRLERNPSGASIIQTNFREEKSRATQEKINSDADCKSAANTVEAIDKEIGLLKTKKTLTKDEKAKLDESEKNRTSKMAEHSLCRERNDKATAVNDAFNAISGFRMEIINSQTDLVLQSVEVFSEEKKTK